MQNNYISRPKASCPLTRLLVEKYSLKTGTKAPFSDGVIIDMDETPEEIEPEGKDRIGSVKYKLVKDGIAQTDNGMTLRTRR